MRILLTNDDGVFADGLLALRQAVACMGEVTVVAPDRPRSASGHSITLHKPLRLDAVKLADGSPAYRSNGTPADCVTLGMHVLLEDRCDLVISGINSGANLGWDLTYSGTVSAAMEATIIGVRAVAISVAGESDLEEYHYEVAANAALELAERLTLHELPKHTLLNVNVPNVPASEIQGWRVTRQGCRQYADRLIPRADPMGRTYYWLGGSLVGERDQPGTDVDAIAGNYISVTPIHLDLTAYTLFDQVEEWLK